MTLALNKPKLDNLAGDIWKAAAFGDKLYPDCICP